MKNWTGNKNSQFSTLGASNHSKHKREEHDYYATDPSAIDGLLSLGLIDYAHQILEPACGEGHLSKALEGVGHTVFSSDLIDRGYGFVDDFLQRNDKFAGHIITNPPYRYAQEFIEKSLELIPTGNYVCMFLKLTFLEGQKRRKFFNKYPPKIVAVYSKRQKCAINGDFENTGSSAACYAWFIWKKGDSPSPQIKWL